MSQSQEIPPPFFLYGPLFSRHEIERDRSLIPECDGIYGWFFKQIPGERYLAEHVDDCLRRDGLTLLYVGVAPGKPSSPRNLRDRIWNEHYHGNAEGSTLRQTLGALLADEIGTILKLHGTRKTFGPNGEQALNQWMGIQRIRRLVETGKAVGT